MKKSIMIVDDIRTIRNTVKFQLSKMGYEISDAEDGIDALQKMVINKPDLLITDLMMPRMDGFELVEKLKSHHELKNIPIIVLSSMENKEDVIKAIHLGADRYVVKPFRIQKLVQEINNLLS